MLTFNLKKEWFEKIKSGEKTHEYRVASEYWQKRIHPITYHGFKDFSQMDIAIKYKYGRCSFRNPEIVFCCGYPKKNDTDKRLRAKIKSITIYPCGLMSDLKTKEPIYDIEFELIGD